MASPSPALTPSTNPGFISAREVKRYARIAKKAGQYKKLQGILAEDLKSRLKAGALVSEKATVELKVEEYAGQAPWKDAFLRTVERFYPVYLHDKVVAEVENRKEKHHRLVVGPKA